jgi:hypothetical protein
MPALVAPVFTVRRAGPGERDASRLRHFTGEQGDDQDAVAIGNIGVFPIDGIGEGDLTVIASHAPFVEEHLFGLIQSPPQVCVNNQLSLLGDLDQDVFRFESGHGSGNCQVVVGAIDMTGMSWKSVNSGMGDLPRFLRSRVAFKCV